MNTLRLTTLLAVLTITATARAQSFRVIAANHADSVVLRWAPLSPQAWEQQRIDGYRVERVIFNGTVPGPAQRIGPERIAPWSLEEFKARFPRDHANAPAAAQVIHGTMGASNDTKPHDADAEIELRWSIITLLADVDVSIAQAAGLRVVDRDAAPDGFLLYRVISLGAHPDTAVVAVNRTLGDYQVPDGPSIVAQEDERRIHLQWDAQASGIFSGYWIERKDGSSAWARLNTRPFVPMHPDSAHAATVLSYTDSTIARNYRPYHYRVRGIDAFGNVSREAPEITAMGRDRTPPPSPEMEGVKDENGKLVVHWAQREATPDLRGYRVEKALGETSVFYPLHRDLLPTGSRQFADTSTMLIAGNYYRVAAVDTAGNTSYSLGGYGTPIDTIAPLPPTDLRGAIDTNGVVTVEWKQGKERDLLGYRVFFANQADHTFINLTPEPIASLAFVDTLPLKTLTKRIFYKVVAVDRNFNHSGFSAMLTLTKPDRVAPVAPLFKTYRSTDSTVVLEFVPSSSDDVKEHVLRRKENNGNYADAERFPAATMPRTWTDRQAQGPATYTYELFAIDSAGNRSPASQAIEVNVRGHRADMRPTQVSAAVDAQKHVRITWQGSTTGVQHYIIHRSRDGAAPVAIGSPRGDVREFVDDRLPGNGSYSYSIRAAGTDGSLSSESNAATVSYAR